MSVKLITLAIFTFEKAQIIKTILESEGIDVSIECVNQIQPIVSAGVRVRIRESDLPKALHVIEDLNLADLNEGAIRDSKVSGAPKGGNVILVPVDFSLYSYKACLWAIRLAGDLGQEVLLLHSIYAPFSFPAAATLDGGFGTVPMDHIPTIKELKKRAEKDMIDLVTQLHQEMENDNNPLPLVRIESEIVTGLPEDMILAMSKKVKPSLIVMGTRGKSNRTNEVIGSVTADVIDRSRVPIIAVTHKTPVGSMSDVKNIGFATSFSQKDLVSFDLLMKIIARYNMSIHLFNISTTEDEWDDIKMKGIREYFNTQYPNASIQYHLLDEGDRLSAMEKFIQKEKIQMVALPIARKSMWIRLFNPSLAQRMLFNNDTPLIVFNTH